MKQRESSRWIEEKIDGEGNLLCLVPTCNDIRQKYKTSNRTRNYCKEHDFGDMRVFTNWASLRNKVLRRDHNKCVKCGTKEKFEFGTINLIADHIIPIALGGDEWDINNIQTLCSDCNKIKTKQDHKDIAKGRRKERLESIGQKRWNGDDYITHPIRVANQVNSDLFKSIAILHDVLEDTDVTIQYLETLFEPNITQTLKLLKHEGNESYSEYICKIKNRRLGKRIWNLYATTIKCFDLMDNLKDLTQKQRKDKYELALLYLRK